MQRTFVRQTPWRRTKNTRVSCMRLWQRNYSSFKNITYSRLWKWFFYNRWHQNRFQQSYRWKTLQLYTHIVFDCRKSSMQVFNFALLDRNNSVCDHTQTLAKSRWTSEICIDQRSAKLNYVGILESLIGENFFMTCIDHWRLIIELSVKGKYAGHNSTTVRKPLSLKTRMKKYSLSKPR
jgi:hypothetical protein